MSTTPPSPSPRRTGLWLRLAAVAVLVIWLAIGGIGGRQVGQLSSLQDNDTTSLPASAESQQAAEQLKKFAGDSETLPLLVVAADDAGISPQVKYNIEQALGTALLKTSPLGQPFGDLVVGEQRLTPIPSTDGKALLVTLPLQRDLVLQKVDDERLLNSLVAAITDATQGLDVTVKQTGPAGFIHDLSGAFAGIDGLLLLVALLVVFVILIIVYRSPFLPLAVLVASVFGLSAAGLIIHPLAKAGVLTVSGQSQGILSILVVGAATDYALLVVARLREEFHHTDSTVTALWRTIKGTVAPIAASGGTVIAGLLCLLLSSVDATRSLGPLAAVGILGALAAALTFLPAILLLAGRRIFWPRIPRHDDATEEVPVKGVWAWVAGKVERFPRTIWVATAAGLALLSLLAPTFRGDGLATEDFFRNPTPAVEGSRLLAAHYPDAQAGSVAMAVPEADVPSVVDRIERIDGVGTVSGGGDPMGRPAQVVDGLQKLTVAVDGGPQSAEAQAMLRTIRDAVHTVNPDIKVGGETAVAVDQGDLVAQDNRTVLPAILLVVFIVLVLVLRSLVAPLLLVVANILSFLATLGVSAFVFNHVFGFPNADPTTPLYAFVFLIALGIDYSIFLMTRVREETPRHGTRKAVLIALAVTGGVITSAGVVLAATFSALFVLPLVFMAQIGFFVAFGVLLDTFVVRSLLVAGLVRDLGGAVWWPARPDRVVEKADDATSDSSPVSDAS